MKTLVRKAVAGFDSDKRTAARLEKLLDRLSADMTIPAKEWISELKDELRSFAKYETSYQSETIGGWVGVNMTEPAFSQVWAAAKFNPVAAQSPVDFIKLMDDWGADEVSRLVTGVKNGFVQGLSTRDIIKSVVGDGGLAGISQSNAMAVARTATMHLANEARFATYQENTDVVIGYTWVSTLDSKTSSICRSRDGQVYLFKDRNQPKPPAHYNCRSTTAPKLSSEFDIFDVGAKRAARGADGGQQVDQSTTYYDFLKRQPAAFQDEVLGKTKGMVFRNAGLSTEEFRKITTDDFGKELTLEQMMVRDRRVAKYLRG
jgi:SPP1 gp7 family putative phage head morphogenesis protein